MSKPTDTEMLDWLIFYGGRVCTSRDGDDAWVKWYSGDGEEELESDQFGDARKAIQAAMKAEAEL